MGQKKPDCIFDDFMFQQDGARAHRSHHTVTYLRSNVPEYIEPENWLPKSPDLSPVDYSVWGNIAADGVSAQNFKHCSAEASSDRLLGSAKSGHSEPRD